MSHQLSNSCIGGCQYSKDCGMHPHHTCYRECQYFINQRDPEDMPSRELTDYVIVVDSVAWTEKCPRMSNEEMAEHVAHVFIDTPGILFRLWVQCLWRKFKFDFWNQGGAVG